MKPVAFIPILLVAIWFSICGSCLAFRPEKIELVAPEVHEDRVEAEPDEVKPDIIVSGAKAEDQVSGKLMEPSLVLNSRVSFSWTVSAEVHPRQVYVTVTPEGFIKEIHLQYHGVSVTWDELECLALQKKAESQGDSKP